MIDLELPTTAQPHLGLPTLAALMTNLHFFTFACSLRLRYHVARLIPAFVHGFRLSVVGWDAPILGLPRLVTVGAGHDVSATAVDPDVEDRAAAPLAGGNSLMAG